MKDGTILCGYIMHMRKTVKEGFILLEDVHSGNWTKILLKNAKSITTESERISITQRCTDEDELQRCRELGWNGVD